MPWGSQRLHAGALIRQSQRPRKIHAHFRHTYIQHNQWVHHESTAKDTTSPNQKGASRTSTTTESNTSEETFPPISIKLLSETQPPEDLSPLLTTSFSHLQSEYKTPRHPIVLAHGLMGFDELRLAGKLLPSVHYWRGIKDAFNAHGIECITTAVPTTGSIDERARALYSQILEKLPPEPEPESEGTKNEAAERSASSGSSTSTTTITGTQPRTPKGRQINIVAHSMGGLDARYLISRLCPDPETEFRVASLTTIATPHRGSSAADMLFRDIGPDLLPRLYKLLSRLKISSGAFSQLTTPYVNTRFNPVTPNSAQTRYFSYGASATPHLLSVFRVSHDLLAVVEGANDGLVSVRSARWGEYKGTLVGVTHLDLINWTNRIKRVAARLGLVEQKFNAVAFYLGVADMLAKEGL
ncbi:hypothetical protein LTR84_006464 [Exophiala bonariae]|uniref:DUF676 domain-containing protein n=1 Tax=Exophiala bonariae TaxID=1690606 RepID=A0AAV9N4S0_9EURO|nr:hypothetical protein LTR84_006464 [Exophiala bonariae]